ncbi:MAG: 2-amino-4-hydroxy-6-hydroxymethyldihydropteridine diphosphokinase [Rhodospirillales bacterium]
MVMLIVALGANLPSRRFGNPARTLGGVVDLLPGYSLTPRRRSHWYRSPPWPPSGQPWYVNGVLLCETLMAPDQVMHALHDLESDLGRRRQHPNQARSLDLDLIDYGGMVSGGDSWPSLPHPRLESRAFVLRPLADVAPDWRNPRDGRKLGDLLAALDPQEVCLRI